jgi:hypothetical protein
VTLQETFYEIIMAEVKGKKRLRFRLRSRKGER